MPFLNEYRAFHKILDEYLETLNMGIDLGARDIYAYLFIELCFGQKSNPKRSKYRTAKEIAYDLTRYYREKKITKYAVSNYIEKNLLKYGMVKKHGWKCNPEYFCAKPPSFAVKKFEKIISPQENDILTFENKNYKDTSRLEIADISESIIDKQRLSLKVAEYTKLTFYEYKNFKYGHKLDMVIGRKCGNILLTEILTSLKNPLGYSKSQCRILVESELFLEPKLKNYFKWITINNERKNKFRDITNIPEMDLKNVNWSNNIIILRKTISKTFLLIIEVNDVSFTTASMITDKSLISSMEIAFDQIWSKAPGI